MDRYPYISFIPDRKTIMDRMRSRNAVFPPELEREIDGYIKIAQDIFSASGAAKETPIVLRDESIVEFEGVRLESRLLSKMLSGSSAVYIMCASLPKRSVDSINEALQKGEGLKALVLDAYASECVDGALDIIIERKNAMLKRTGKRLTKKRFSAGYGDLDIKYQKQLYDILDMRLLGVSINDSFLLSPEKSVIAIAGVE